MPIILVGPTAVGKTDVAVELARRIDGEIINADSMQIYRGMDIGTAKPDHRARQFACFHLLDLVSPDEPFNVSEWKERAEQSIRDIAARGRQPIICGGTGLYIRALTDNWGLACTPQSPTIRQALQCEALSIGSGALHRRLSDVDPVTAARLHPNDSVRIIRALEVHEVTGTPLSEFLALDKRARAVRRFCRVGLILPRETLYARINARVDHMIAQGLEEEVCRLVQAGYADDLGPMRSLGYKEMCSVRRGEMDRTTAIDAIKLNTRRFSKRQQTWFRADSQIRWIDIDAFNSATVAALVQDVLERETHQPHTM